MDCYIYRENHQQCRLTHHPGKRGRSRIWDRASLYRSPLKKVSQSGANRLRTSNWGAGMRRHTGPAVSPAEDAGAGECRRFAGDAFFSGRGMARSTHWTPPKYTRSAGGSGEPSRGEYRSRTVDRCQASIWNLTMAAWFQLLTRSWQSTISKRRSRRTNQHGDRLCGKSRSSGLSQLHCRARHGRLEA